MPKKREGEPGPLDVPHLGPAARKAMGNVPPGFNPDIARTGLYVGPDVVFGPRASNLAGKMTELYTQSQHIHQQDPTWNGELGTMLLLRGNDMVYFDKPQVSSISQLDFPTVKSAQAKIVEDAESKVIADQTGQVGYHFELTPFGFGHIHPPEHPYAALSYGDVISTVAQPAAADDPDLGFKTPVMFTLAGNKNGLDAVLRTPETPIILRQDDLIIHTGVWATEASNLINKVAKLARTGVNARTLDQLKKAQEVPPGQERDLELDWIIPKVEEIYEPYGKYLRNNHLVEGRNKTEIDLQVLDHALSSVCMMFIVEEMAQYYNFIHLIAKSSNEANMKLAANITGAIPPIDHARLSQLLPIRSLDE